MLTLEQRRGVVLDKPLLEAKWERARRDPLHFLGDFVYTCDQHDTEHPIKRFPAERPHIVHLTRLWQDNPLLLLKKSRQMLVTWWAVAMSLWDGLFHRGRLWMLQSAREDDAIGDRVSGDGLQGRALFMLDHMPGRQWLCMEGRDWQIRDGNKIQVPAQNSTLWAIPQGAAIIRQRTASGVLSDEAAYQKEFADAYVAAMPCIRGGGRFVGVSSAHPGFFEELVEDRVGEQA